MSTEENNQEKSEENDVAQMSHPALVSSGMLDFNIAEHVTKKLMLENNIMMMRMQMKKAGEILRPPQLQEMEETHIQITGNLMLLVEEKDLRMKDIDAARREEYLANPQKLS
jgi:hypothetical protein